MRNLLVVPFPGDEVALYAALLLARRNTGQAWDALLLFDRRPEGPDVPFEAWRRSITSAWGIGNVARLGLPALPPRDIDPAAAARIRPHLGGHDRIFVPDPCGGDLHGVVAATLVAMAHDGGELWCRTAAGPPTAVCTLDRAGLERLIDRLNRCYPDQVRSGAVDVGRLSAAAPFRAVPALALARCTTQFEPRLADAAGLMAAVGAKDRDPWDLAGSAYEAERHALELQVLRGLDWRDLAEVGPCRGAFTARLAAAFPERPITAVEVNASFAETVRRLGLPNVAVVERAAAAFDEPFDLLLFSSCLYYMEEWPGRAVAAARRHVVTSHLRSFEDGRVVPAMVAAGWSCRAERELAPRLELFEGFPVRRDGTVVHVWQRGEPAG